MNHVVLSLGSNTQCTFEGQTIDSLVILQKACSVLEDIFFAGTFKLSSVYSTKPLYYEEQNDFYNMVVCGSYDGKCDDLLRKTQSIEALFGRNRSKEIRNGPRSLDIDIAIFGSLCIKTTELTIPHEKMKERAFVLIPLLEILPGYADPISGISYDFFLSTLSDQGVHKVPPFQLS